VSEERPTVPSLVISTSCVLSVVDTAGVKSACRLLFGLAYGLNPAIVRNCSSGQRVVETFRIGIFRLFLIWGHPRSRDRKPIGDDLGGTLAPNSNIELTQRDSRPR